MFSPKMDAFNIKETTGRSGQIKSIWATYLDQKAKNSAITQQKKPSFSWNDL